MLVRTSGSRHTGQAAPPHQNIQLSNLGLSQQNIADSYSVFNG